MRLQKYLAMAGVASRRACEELIRAGKVSVNGAVVTQMGQEVTEDDEVRYEGEVVRPARRMRYLMLNKPEGVVTTSADPQGRPTVLDLIQDVTERIHPVGRLDIGTEGLLLLTNDGELANRLTHPRYAVDKQYRVTVHGHMENNQLERLREGVVLDDGHKTSPAQVRVTESLKGTTVIEVIVHEGHNRLIRRMFAAVDKKVAHLTRTKIGNLSLGGLPVGRWRHLSPGEVAYLKQMTGMES